jgi:shikimate kinase
VLAGATIIAVANRHPQRNIILVGFHHAGKTSVGRELSRRLRRGFIDVPVEARRRRLGLFRLAGKPEPQLEDAERRLIADLAYKREVIAALACDASLDPQVLEDLRVFSYIVFLDIPFEICWARLLADPMQTAEAQQQGRAELLRQWQAWRAELAGCDLQLFGPAQDARRLAQLVLHCFFT